MHLLGTTVSSNSTFSEEAKNEENLWVWSSLVVGRAIGIVDEDEEE